LPLHIIFFSCFSEEFGSGKVGEEIKATEEVSNRAVGRFENPGGHAVINCHPAPPVPVVLYEIKVTDEVKNSEPVSKQNRVQDWINDRAVGISDNQVGQDVINSLPAPHIPVVLYESQGHLQPLEDPSVILTSPQFPKKKYTESKMINSLKLNPFGFVVASET
jgi:hypothetical protein